MNNEISFEGIDPAALVHALYHGTRPLGLGILHDRPGLSVEDVSEALREKTGEVYIDYFFGRPLKTQIDLQKKTFTTRLYDRDAGDGAAARVVARLRGGQESP